MPAGRKTASVRKGTSSTMPGIGPVLSSIRGLSCGWNSIAGGWPPPAQRSSRREGRYTPYQMVKNLPPCSSIVNVPPSPASTCPGSRKSVPGSERAAQHVEHRDAEQGRADAVAADVEQVDGEVVVVEPVVAERVASERGARG